jgi:autotransporter-associated beta strand protein
MSGGGSNLTLRVTSNTSGDTTTTYRFAGNNSFSGKVELFRGAIVVADANGLGNATLQLNGDTVIPAGTAVTTSGLLSLNTGAASIGSLAGGGTVSAITAGTRTLITGANNASTTFSGIISNNAGTVGITKAGTGTFTLTGANTYTGATTINGGTLAIGTGGALSATTAVAINNGGTLRLDRFDIWGNHNLTASAPITVAAGGGSEQNAEAGRDAAQAKADTNAQAQQQGSAHAAIVARGRKAWRHGAPQGTPGHPRARYTRL